jgi:hypothetical protein
VGEIPSEHLHFVEAGVAPRRDAHRTPSDHGAPRRWRVEVEPEDLPEPPAGDWVDPRTLLPGQWVRHPEWGRGKILSREGDGMGLKLVILFQGYLQKKVLARYARLELE